MPVNFNSDTENIEISTDDYSMVVAQRAKNQRDKVFRVNVISGGERRGIYTVWIKKYEKEIGNLFLVF